MKKTTFLLLFVFSTLIIDAQTVISRDFESATIGATGASQGYSLIGGSSDVQVATSSGNSSQVLKVIHTNDANDLFLRTGSINVVPGETYEIQFDIALTNPVHVLKVRTFPTEQDDLNNTNITLLSADAGTVSTTNGSASSSNLGRIEGGTTNTFGTTKAQFTIPSGVNFAKVQIYQFGKSNTFELDNFMVTKMGTASLEDLETFNFSAYPNPASKFLNITANKPIERIQVFNLIGKSLIDVKPKSEKTKLNISNLHRGIYLISSTINGKIGTYKFIKE